MFLLNFNKNKPLQYSIILYILLLIIFNLLKPDITFDKDGQRKNFGIGRNKTLFPFEIQCLLSSIFLYLILNIYY